METRMKAKVICETKLCPNEGGVVNTVTFPKEEEDTFYESFGHGGEECADFCQTCGKLGILQDPETQYELQTWIAIEGPKPTFDSKEEAEQVQAHWQLLHPENKYEIKEI